MDGTAAWYDGLNRPEVHYKLETYLMGKYTFSSANIDRASDEVAEFLGKFKIHDRDIMKLRLTLEEILLTYRDKLGETAEFRVKCVTRFRRPRVELSVAGEAINPFEQEDDEYRLLYRLASNLGNSPVWQYKNGNNIVVFMPQKGTVSQTKKILLGIIAGVAAGLVCCLCPENTRLFISSGIVSPLTDTFMGLLAAISGPLIFLSVLNSIGEMGDMQSFGKIGKKTVARLTSVTFFLGLATLCIMLPFFKMSSGGGASFDGSSLYTIVLDIIPENFFTPFTEGNPLQIIFIAVIAGIALLLLGNKACTVSSLTVQLGYVVNTIMEGLSSFMPYFIFGVIFDMIVSGSFAAILESYKVLLIILLATAALVPFYLVRVSVTKKVSPVLLIRKVLPAFLIALTTASSSAAFSTNVEVCEKRLGIDKRLVNFGVPLGQIIVMPSHIAMYLGIALSQAQNYDVAITPAWLVIAFISSFILALATPPIMGGTFVVFSNLFMQLGIPAEAIGVAAMLSVLLDFIATAVNVFCLQGELIELGGKLDLLDRDTLRKRV